MNCLDKRNKYTQSTTTTKTEVGWGGGGGGEREREIRTVCVNIPLQSGLVSRVGIIGVFKVLVQRHRKDSAAVRDLLRMVAWCFCGGMDVL